MRRIIVSVAAAAVTTLTGTSALACPLCRSDTGERVRAGIFDNEFGGTLLAMVLPFLVISLVVAVLHGGLPRAARSQATPTDGRPGADGGRPDFAR